jgi:hypothetical protein
MMVSGKVMIPVLAIMVGVSGFRGAFFSVEHLLSEAPPTVITLCIGWLSGAVVGPFLLSWLPGERASFKGVMAGGLGLLMWPLSVGFMHLRPVDVVMAILMIPVMASFLMMWLAGRGMLGLLTVESRERFVALVIHSVMAVVGMTPWVLARFF